jgi:threonine/homoserine/homoserine lactone efflux protein
MILDYCLKLQKNGSKRVLAAFSSRNIVAGKHVEKVRRSLRRSLTHSVRGRFGYMQYIHGFIGCVLVLLALIHVPYPAPFAWLPYAGAAVLAFITLKSEIGLRVSTILAIATAAIMFFFFAWFFLLAPKLAADWYANQTGWAAVCRILGAFVMIPILSEYSCRLKADCREARAARRTAFFSVPSHIRPESR